jgi:hypothetical protein
MMLIFVLRKLLGVGSGELGLRIADCGLRIADCGFMNLFNREREIGIESFINPQSAIRNPNSPLKKRLS